MSLNWKMVRLIPNLQIPLPRISTPNAMQKEENLTRYATLLITRLMDMPYLGRMGFTMSTVNQEIRKQRLVGNYKLSSLTEPRIGYR